MIGKFKDETCGVSRTEFLGLRSKMYSYVKDDNKSSHTAKGIKNKVIEKDIKYEITDKCFLIMNKDITR